MISTASYILFTQVPCLARDRSNVPLWLSLAQVHVIFNVINLSISWLNVSVWTSKIQGCTSSSDQTPTRFRIMREKGTPLQEKHERYHRPLVETGYEFS